MKKEIALDGDLIGVRESETRRRKSCLLPLLDSRRIPSFYRCRVRRILYDCLKLLDHFGGVLDGDFDLLNSFS